MACAALPSDVAERVRRKDEGGGDGGGEDENNTPSTHLFDGGGGKSSGGAWGGNGGDGSKTTKEVALEFTEEEREEIRRMKGSPNLYTQVSFKNEDSSCVCTGVQVSLLL